MVPEKEKPLWQELIEPRTTVFDSFGQDCTRLKLFEWLTAPKVRSKIIENIYPMHPMATFALLQLSRDVASNNRSVYTFFSEGDPSSYADFIAHAPVLAANGKLNLYTADLLFHYFASALKSDNKELRDTVRDHIRDYEHSVRALNQIANADTLESVQFKGDELIARILRIMLVYEIIGKPNRFDNLAFGLYCSTHSERDELANRLNALATHNVLFYIKEKGVYEFKKSVGINLDTMIETWIKNPANAIQNAVVELNELVPLDKNSQYLEAKGYNLQYSEDKQLLRRFVRAADLGTVEETPQGRRTYFQKLDDEIAAAVAKKSDFEGISLYVVCESQEETGKARDCCANNQSERIVIAIPREPVRLVEAILDLKALLAIEKTEEYKNYSTQDKSAFNERLNGSQNRTGARQALLKLRDRFLSAKEITWYGTYAHPLPTDDTNPYDAANRVTEQLYTDRNTFSHDDYNKLHNKIDKKAQALKEAVEKLLDYSEQVVINTDNQQRGDYRYLQKCLLNHGALRQVKADGSKLRCDFEDDTSRYSVKLPALAQMVHQVKQLGSNGEIRVADWMQEYRRPPYGQGTIALAISLAFMRYQFRDSIRFKIDKTAIGDMPVRTLDDVLMLIDGSCPNAFLSYRPLSAAEKTVVNTVYSIFGTPDSAVTKDYTVVEAHSALKTWWEDLPPVAKVAKFYPSAEPATAAFIQVMQKVSGKDAHAFLFEELPIAFDLDTNLAVTSEFVQTIGDGLPIVKDRLESALSGVEERIIGGVRELFGVEQNTHTDIANAIADWINKLDSNQRDLSAKWQTGASKAILFHLKSLKDLRQAFCVEIPKTSEYGMRTVHDWTIDRVHEFLSQLKSAREHIEANRIKVEPPDLEADDASELLEAGKLSFKGKTELKFSKPKNGAKIYIAEGSADPTDSNSVRQELNSDGTIVISENKTIRYAAQDTEGNWSPVQVLQLTNANAPFIPTLSAPNLFNMRSVQFNLKDGDAESLTVACRELFQQCVKLKVMDAAQMEAAVTQALKEAKAAL